MADLKFNLLAGWVWNTAHAGFVALSLAKPEATYKRHLGSTGRVRASNSPSPEPCDYGALLPTRELHLWVKMPDPALCLIAHPLTVIAHVLGQTLCTSPNPRSLQGATGVRMHRWSICELRREFDKRLGD